MHLKALNLKCTSRAYNDTDSKMLSYGKTSFPFKDNGNRRGVFGLEWNEDEFPYRIYKY